MLEIAVAEGVALLGKIGYDVWKRWLDNKSPGAAVVSNGSPSYAQDPMAIPSMLPHRGAELAPSLLTVSFFPQDDQAAEYIFEEQPCLLVVADINHPEVDGFVVAGRFVDIHEILLPPGRYDVSAFVFDDEALETL